MPSSGWMGLLSDIVVSLSSHLELGWIASSLRLVCFLGHHPDILVGIIVAGGTYSTSLLSSAAKFGTSSLDTLVESPVPCLSTSDSISEFTDSLSSFLTSTCGKLDLFPLFFLPVDGFLHFFARVTNFSLSTLGLVKKRYSTSSPISSLLKETSGSKQIPLAIGSMLCPVDNVCFVCIDFVALSSEE